jgi:hypothetical protein
LLAGRPKLLDRRKDGRRQRCPLANNLAANAADLVKAVHGVNVVEDGHRVKIGMAAARPPRPVNETFTPASHF